MEYIKIFDHQAEMACEVLDDDDIRNEFIDDDRILVDTNTNFDEILSEVGIEWEYIE